MVFSGPSSTFVASLSVYCHTIHLPKNIFNKRKGKKIYNYAHLEQYHPKSFSVKLVSWLLPRTVMELMESWPKIHYLAGWTKVLVCDVTWKWNLPLTIDLVSLPTVEPFLCRRDLTHGVKGSCCIRVVQHPVHDISPLWHLSIIYHVVSSRWWMQLFLKLCTRTQPGVCKPSFPSNIRWFEPRIHAVALLLCCFSVNRDALKVLYTACSVIRQIIVSLLAILQK